MRGLASFLTSLSEDAGWGRVLFVSVLGGARRVGDLLASLSVDARWVEGLLASRGVVRPSEATRRHVGLLTLLDPVENTESCGGLEL